MKYRHTNLKRKRRICDGKILHNRLCSSSGETLVESLVSILIIGLSIGFMIILISRVKALDLFAFEKDNAFYNTLSSAEVKTESVGSAIVTLSGDGLEDIYFSVYRYGGDTIISYKS